ncbi:hypothetical protein L596_018760 [Steinernema carpocapsae]|uniref:Cullin N-terminal domain-containing protein n=1 Tax=Steinernema carpocapsae TaxID=34508 RepID=A0A4U5N5M9_STECR|nr:hypothetical protein L596_018760 [Steinernema carpocapsae]
MRSHVLNDFALLETLPDQRSPRRFFTSVPSVVREMRQGQNVDPNVVKNVQDMLKKFGVVKNSGMDEFDLDDGQLQEHRMRFFVEFFETPLVAVTHLFFRRESARLLKNFPFERFAREALKMVEDEERRCEKVFDVHSKEAILAEVEKLIWMNLERIKSGFLNMLKANRFEDVDVVLRFCSRCTEATTEIQKMSEKHVRKVGMEAGDGICGPFGIRPSGRGGSRTISTRPSRSFWKRRRIL